MGKNSGHEDRRQHLTVLLGDGGDRDAAARASSRLGAPLAEQSGRTDGAELILLFDRGGVSLTDGAMTLRGDFARMVPRIREQNLRRELLVRASGIRNARKENMAEDTAGQGCDPDTDGAGEMEGRRPLAVDATAGLGEDSLILAAAGFSVMMFERDPVIALLAADALRRASGVPELRETVSAMKLYEGDSIEALPGLRPDIVLLDPMFPAKQKRSLTNKKLQLFQKLEAPCTDGNDLVRAAFLAGPRRILIKRPLKGEYLAGVRPEFSYTGKTVRYDCLVPLRGRAAGQKTT